MTRGITDARATELANQQLTIVTMVAIPDIGDGHYSTDAPVDITSSVTGTSKTYESAKGHLAISEIKEGEDISIEQVTLTLSAVPSDLVKLVLDNDYINKQVLIYQAILDDSYSVIGDPILVFDGRAESPSIKENFANRNAQISLTVTNHWSDFQLGRGRRTNDNDQQTYFSGDRFFQYAKDVEKDIKWGRE